MNKKINVSAVVIGMTIIIVIGFLAWTVNKKKNSIPATAEAPATDMHGHPVAAKVPAMALQDFVNKPAPDFTLADRDGKQYSLNELRGKNIILFFNEGLMCYPACWTQIVSLADDARFKSDDTMVLSVVVDPPGEWQSAINKMPELAKATVVFDNGAVVSKQFGMLTTASSMHYGSLPGHSFIVIDKAGVIRHIYDDPGMGIHNDQLAAELGTLSK